MAICINDIPHFIIQWGTQLKTFPEYEIYFENSFIGNYLSYFLQNQFIPVHSHIEFCGFVCCNYISMVQVYEFNVNV